MTAQLKTDGNVPLSIMPFVDYDTARKLVAREWGIDALVIGGKAYRTEEMTLRAAFLDDGSLAGVAFYRLSGMVALLGAIIVDVEGKGVGTALFDTVVADARMARLKKLRAITTNDNFRAMHFFQKRGMRLMSLFPGGVDAFRAFKPGLIEMGHGGLPCRDILELEMDL
jgi:ribosomal protein S18 acetylase RimI-like enzyme